MVIVIVKRSNCIESDRSEDGSGGGVNSQRRNFSLLRHFDTLHRSSRSIDTMSSSTDSNPTNGQQVPALSVTSLVSAMNSGSSVEKLKARIISTDKLMQLLNKKVKGKKGGQYICFKETNQDTNRM